MGVGSGRERYETLVFLEMTEGDNGGGKGKEPVSVDALLAPA